MTTSVHGEAQVHTSGHVLNWPGFVYDLASNLLSFGRAGRMRKAIIALAGLRQGEDVLDVGCGTGTLAILARQVVGPTGSVHGIDPAPRMIAAARRKAKRQGALVDFQPGAIEALPFADHSFNIVLSSFMLHHLPDDVKRKGLSEVRRVLKTGGRFFAVDFRKEGFSLHDLVAHVLGAHHGPEADVAKVGPLLEQAGFHDIRTEPTGFKSVSYVQAIA